MQPRPSRPSRLFLIAIAACFLLTPHLTASPTPVGSEMQVNSATAGRQLNPRIAARPGGGAVGVWEDEQSGADRTVFARLFDAGGQAVGAEFQVSVGTDDDRTSPSVAALPSGDVLVSWEDSTDDGDFIAARRYDSLGQPGGVLTLQAADGDVDVFDPLIVGAEAGTFVVTWGTYDSNVQESAFRARRVSDAGAPLGTPFTLESAIADDFVSSGALSPRAGDGFVLAWQFDGDVTGREARVRRFDAAGAPDGGATPITAASSPREPQVAGLADDGFLVAWLEGTDDLKWQRILGTGGFGAVVDAAPSTRPPRNPTLVPVPGDRGALAWAEAGASGDPDSVFLQFINADDSIVDLTVSSSDFTLSHPDVAYDAAAGELLVVWVQRGGAGADQEEILLRRYALDILFGDGFESGDTSAWSELVILP
ncbi:MAG: hypothetical protein AAGM22_26670 [Acidobacteriota bacterium]